MRTCLKVALRSSSPGIAVRGIFVSALFAGLAFGGLPSSMDF